ncbi:glycosyltransferase family 4 protein [Desulfococcaceae bacterium HSG9]|nr:glycosyltransferase family 4 protein [Desulfococcaceae bacterium HSG9]
MKKLLICTQSYALHGGVENIVNDLCLELPQRGWETLLALGKGACYNDVERYRNQYPNVPIVEIDGVKGTRQSRSEALVKVIKKVKPDIVLSARLFDAYMVINKLKKHNRRIYFAVTVQAYEPPYFYDMNLFGETVDLCITSGNMIKKGIIHLSQLPENIVVSIPGGVRTPKKTVRPRTPGKTLRIGYVGRIEQEQKRISDIFPLLQELDLKQFSYRVDIVGTGLAEDKLRKKLKYWINIGRVIFHGWRQQHELYNKFYPAMDCLVHFAHTEGVTIAPREAMSHGVVPIISQFTGLKAEGHFLHNINALTFPVGNIDVATENIQRLITEPELMKNLSSNAIQSQTGKYSFEGSMDTWAQALDECIKRPPMPEMKMKPDLPPDGRLTQYGLSPWLAQRIRDIFGKRFVHSNPGSEWPTNSGWMTKEAEMEILRFAKNYEKQL